MIEDNQKRLQRLHLLAALMDMRFRIPWTRIHIGWDGLLGLAPIAGDLLSAAVSLYIVLEARRLGARPGTILHMLLNVAVDLLVGLFPVIGDIVDILWQANRMNIDLLERDLQKLDEELSDRR